MSHLDEDDVKVIAHVVRALREPMWMIGGALVCATLCSGVLGGRHESIVSAIDRNTAAIEAQTAACRPPVAP